VNTYVLGSAPEVRAEFRVNDVLTNPTTLKLTIQHPDGTEEVTNAPTPTSPPAPIIFDSTGVFHAEFVADEAGVWAYRWEGTGAATGANEGQFAITTMVVDVLSFLTRPADYDGIRGLLGVTVLDVTDDMVQLPPFGPTAEAYVKFRIANWQDQMLDATKAFVLRLAAGYATAALMAETIARGGFAGLLGQDDRTVADWLELSERLWKKYAEWLGRAEETDTVPTDVYDVTLQVVSGPTRAAYTAAGVPRWWKYPPLVGVPPDFSDRLLLVIYED
jgi:hypothetical protein